MLKKKKDKKVYTFRKVSIFIKKYKFLFSIENIEVHNLQDIVGSVHNRCRMLDNVCCQVLEMVDTMIHKYWLERTWNHMDIKEHILRMDCSLVLVLKRCCCTTFWMLNIFFGELEILMFLLWKSKWKWAKKIFKWISKFTEMEKKSYH